MEIIEYIAALEIEGARLADTAAAIDLDAPVPTCPGWALRDILRHLGGVHRWAGSHIRDQATSIYRVDDLETLFGAWPADAELVDWYRGELALLDQTLREASDDVQCATFLKAPSPLAHWTRRQAFEVTIHRADVESTLELLLLTPVDPEFGADGIDELVAAFLPRRFMNLRSDEPWTLSIVPSDSPRRWRLTISQDPVQTVEGDTQPSDCTVRGKASDLFFALWNRYDDAPLKIEGDESLYRQFGQQVKITWS
jgi:uncharacterized protein (TIGR03083 family)